MFERGFLGVLGAACLLASVAFFFQRVNLVGVIFGLIGAILLVIVLRGQRADG